MALDVSTAYRQVQRISQQSAAAAHLKRKLETYKASLLFSWTGREAEEYGRIIDSLIEKSAALSISAETTARNMAQAIQDILEEEAAAGTLE